MWKLALLTLLACGPAAVAAPPPSQPPPSSPSPVTEPVAEPGPGPAPIADAPAAEPEDHGKPACEAKGPMLAEVDRIKAGSPGEKQQTMIFENGAWSATDSRPDAKPASGCVPPADMTPLRESLAKATWKVTTAKIHCMAVSAIHTEYKVKDKLVWSARLCSGQSLDKDSQLAIEQLDKTVDEIDPDHPKLN